MSKTTEQKFQLHANFFFEILRARTKPPYQPCFDYAAVRLLIFQTSRIMYEVLPADDIDLLVDVLFLLAKYDRVIWYHFSVLDYRRDKLVFPFFFSVYRFVLGVMPYNQKK